MERPFCTSKYGYRTGRSNRPAGREKGLSHPGTRKRDTGPASAIVYFGLFQIVLQPLGVIQLIPPMEKTIYSQEYTRFLQLLRAVREEMGITQVELADRLQATQSFVSKCERGERRLDFVEARAWCSALGVPLRDFVQRFDENLRGQVGRLR